MALTRFFTDNTFSALYRAQGAYGPILYYQWNGERWVSRPGLRKLIKHNEVVQIPEAKAEKLKKRI